MKKYDAKFLAKRKRLAMRFINKVLQSPELCASPVLLDFLSFSDAKKYTKSLKSALEKDPVPRSLSQMGTVSGHFIANNDPKY